MPVITITQPPTHKIGSTWRFVLRRKQPDGTPVNLTGLTVRSTFREQSVTGPVFDELTEGDGIEIDADAGLVKLELIATSTGQTVPAIWIYFDVEMTGADGDVWQSPTYRFKTEAEVTRD
jgi:hypothetical protein